MKNSLMRFQLVWVVGVLCGYGAPVAHAEEWPILFTNISLTAVPYKGAEIKDISGDCQPQFFDPQKAKYHHSHSASGDYYELEGKDASEALSMEIIAGVMRDGKNSQLSAPYSLTRYAFSCASAYSQVFEIKNNGARHALYTHISSAIFSPDLKKMVIFNYLKNPDGQWQEQRRIIEMDTKSAAALPVINETSYIADMSNGGVVTYSGPLALPPNPKENGRRLVAIWGNDGKLIRALSVPIQTTDANAESSFDGIGVLPKEPSTFYHLTRTGQDQCTLRLQSIEKQNEHRSIQLAVPGLASDQTNVGMRVQIKLDDLGLKKGGVKYRVAASGRGDVVKDWGPWEIAK